MGAENMLLQQALQHVQRTTRSAASPAATLPSLARNKSTRRPPSCPSASWPLLRTRWRASRRRARASRSPTSAFTRGASSGPKAACTSAAVDSHTLLWHLAQDSRLMSQQQITTCVAADHNVRRTLPVHIVLARVCLMRLDRTRAGCRFTGMRTRCMDGSLPGAIRPVRLSRMVFRSLSAFTTL